MQNVSRPIQRSKLLRKEGILDPCKVRTNAPRQKEGQYLEAGALFILPPLVVYSFQFCFLYSSRFTRSERHHVNGFVLMTPSSISSSIVGYVLMKALSTL